MLVIERPQAGEPISREEWDRELEEYNRKVKRDDRITFAILGAVAIALAGMLFDILVVGAEFEPATLRS